jgi:NitT/TauT family transport system substrate-binding protein
VEISDQGMEAEFADRPVFALDAQISNMNRSAGSSKVDTWLGNIGEFMKAVGTIPDVPDAKSYIDDTYMKKVAADPALKAMATKAD